MSLAHDIADNLKTRPRGLKVDRGEIRGSKSIDVSFTLNGLEYEFQFAEANKMDGAHMAAVINSYTKVKI